MINGNFKEETVLYYLSSYTFLPCKSFVNAVCFFFKGWNSERKQLAGWIPQKQNKTKRRQKKPKKSHFFLYCLPRLFI